MAQQWRYLLPSILSILFVLISIYYHFSLIFVVLLLANFLNWKWGEFSSQELSETLKYFYSSRNARIIKTINALILFGFIFWSITFVDRSNFSLIELIFFTVSIGIFTGCFIITLGHDLLHSRSFFHRALSTVLFTISGIPHFATEHICGHHREVGLKEDPTTALQNESFYTYFFKITYSNFRDIWIYQFGLPGYMKRKILVSNIGMLVFLFSVWFCIYYFSNHSGSTLAFFIGQGLISYLMYQLINYIQHYGLLRSHKNAPITQNLAWNCYYKYTNYILFLLPLHSLHHLTHKDCKIEQLKDGPRMPYLYFLMILLALIPPLWFHKMNKLLKSQNLVAS